MFLYWMSWCSSVTTTSSCIGGRTAAVVMTAVVNAIDRASAVPVSGSFGVVDAGAVWFLVYITPRVDRAFSSIGYSFR